MKKALVFVAVGAALLVGLASWFQPPQSSENPATSAQNGARSERQFDFVLQGGARQSGPGLITVEQGQSVSLTVVSDQPDELHVHGYDRALDVPAGQPVTLELLAEHAGRFEIELHASHQQLAVLEVLPR